MLASEMPVPIPPSRTIVIFKSTYYCWINWRVLLVPIETFKVSGLEEAQDLVLVFQRTIPSSMALSLSTSCTSLMSVSRNTPRPTNLSARKVWGEVREGGVSSDDGIVMR